MIFRTSKLWLKSIQVLTVLISYLSKKKCQWKIANPKHQDYVEIIPQFFESSTKICVPFLGDILSSLFVHSYQTRFFLMSFIWYLRFVFVCICRKTLKDKQQDANCLQIDLISLILLGKLCFSWNDLIHHLSLVYLPPLPMGTCTLYKSRWPENQMWGTFFTLFKGLFIRASWSQKGEGV